MPWITVDEPFAKPPRVVEVSQKPEWAPPLSVDRGWAELSGVTVSGDPALDLGDCQELTIEDSALTGIAVGGEGSSISVEIYRSHLDGCDLSGRSIRNVRGTRLTACKMIGTDFAGGVIADTIFERCVLRYANLRMAKLSRVQFVDCSFDEVDCYQMEAADVSFPGSTLVAVGLDSLNANRFDLREANEITLSAITRLEGCLVSEHQLAGMAHSLAMAAGIQVEREIDDQDLDQ
ncbi:MAG: pentapeptide repeat-containing protein [Acidimicrobiales bacterium]